MERIHGSYRFIVAFNLTLIALGVAGVLPSTTSALLHNGSTLGISLRNMTDLLDDLTVIDNEYFVGIAHSFQPMGNHDDRLIISQLRDGLH